jgi:hypothetical protein
LREEQDRHEQRQEHVPLEPRDRKKEQRDHGNQAGERNENAVGNHSRTR